MNPSPSDKSETSAPSDKITPAQIAVLRDEWDKMKEFLGLPPDTDTDPTTTRATLSQS